MSKHNLNLSLIHANEDLKDHLNANGARASVHTVLVSGYRGQSIRLNDVFYLKLKVD